MPLPVPFTSPSTNVVAYGNAYFNESARTIEFGARIYNTPEAARTRALSSSINENLTYLGPVCIETPVSEGFVLQGIASDAPRRSAILAEREAQEADASDDTSADVISTLTPTTNSGEIGEIQRNIPTL